MLEKAQKKKKTKKQKNPRTSSLNLVLNPQSLDSRFGGDGLSPKQPALQTLLVLPRLALFCHLDTSCSSPPAPHFVSQLQLLTFFFFFFAISFHHVFAKLAALPRMSPILNPTPLRCVNLYSVFRLHLVITFSGVHH